MARGDTHGRHSGTVPFWVHQIVEMLLAVVLLFEGARTDEHVAVLVGLGVALLLFSLVSDGTIAAWPLLGRRAHRVGDFVAAATLAVSPLLLSVDTAIAIVLLEGAAAALLWLALQTNWAPKRASRRFSGRSRPSPSPTTAPARPTAAPVTEPPAPTIRPPAARRLGAAVGWAKSDGPRALGRAVGRAKMSRNQASRNQASRNQALRDRSSPNQPAPKPPPPAPESAPDPPSPE